MEEARLSRDWEKSTKPLLGIEKATISGRPSQQRPGPFMFQPRRRCWRTVPSLRSSDRLVEDRRPDALGKKKLTELRVSANGFSVEAETVMQHRNAFRFAIKPAVSPKGSFRKRGL